MVVRFQYSIWICLVCVFHSYPNSCSSHLSRGYVDACKIVKGLEPKFGHFVTKAAVIPDVPIETKGPEEETKVASKKDSKKETKKESAGLSPAETKDSNGFETTV